MLEGERLLVAMGYNLIKMHRSQWRLLLFDAYAVSLFNFSNEPSYVLSCCIATGH